MGRLTRFDYICIGCTTISCRVYGGESDALYVIFGMPSYKKGCLIPVTVILNVHQDQDMETLSQISNASF